MEIEIQPPDEELLATLIQMSSGDATPDQYVALEERLCADTSVCDQVVSGLVHLANLEWESCSYPLDTQKLDLLAGIEPSQPTITAEKFRLAKDYASTSPPGSSSQHLQAIKRPWAVISTTAAAFLVGAAASYFLWGQARIERIVLVSQDLHDGPGGAQTEPLPPIATLVRNTSYILESHGGTPMGIGAPLHSGASVTLLDGVAEFEFASGVSVLLKGPAVLEIDASGKPNLRYGSLVTRHVPYGPNEPWQLAIPLAVLRVPAGATVGVDAFGEEAVVHAFERDTQVVPISGNLSEVTLPAGHAFRLRRDAHSEVSMLAIALKPEAFDFEGQMDDGHLDLPVGYADLIMNSQPIAYWRFDSIESGSVRDDSAGSNPLQLIGEGVRVVRGASNNYVSFAVRKNRSCFVSAASLNKVADGDYAVEFWFKPHHYHRGAVVSLVEHATDERGAVERHGLIIEAHSASPASPSPDGIETSPKSVRFLHRSPPNELLSGVACFSNTPYRLNAWQHITAVKADNSLRLYLDGELACVESDATTLPHGLSIVVGQLFSFGSVRPFVGELDELAFYDHALSEEEIAKRVSGIHTMQPQRSPSTGVGR
ncbi:LamG-like jellyroll fold domain-containing protein [Botrimarina hoheduenensis]|uniref:LamG-like jellyroll fold domain-containing protein n=1 Tax=Botrimarina hoheduenensis TaxID=2528000 RepID=A0A5C5VNB6_9BACT|nr:LamG domain-containing protein [Botrimarina hoheduenensis]TWT40114.1 hypothetical protein Pla111_34430 [Botrimarina hoheduenensis]